MGASTHQVILYRRRRRAGLCVECGKKAVVSMSGRLLSRCLRHTIRKRQQVRELRGGELWRKGGPGRKPSVRERTP